MAIQPATDCFGEPEKANSACGSVSWTWCRSTSDTAGAGISTISSWPSVRRRCQIRYNDVPKCKDIAIIFDYQIS